MDYSSNILLGLRYRDRDTQFEGVAIALTIYEYGCHRVLLRALISSVPSDQWFDAPKLKLVKTPKPGFTTSRWGGK